MSLKFNVRSSRFIWRRTAAISSLLLLAVAGYWLMPMAVRVHGGVDDEPKAASPPVAGPPVISIVTAERNIQNEAGNFNLVLKRSPGDERAGETEQFLIRIAEKVEGGFGGGGPLPVEKATVLAAITHSDGRKVAESLPVKAEANGNYRTSYYFGGAGDYKIVFSVTTEDGRSFSADFPVSVTKAPVLWSFWIVLLILSFLTLGSLGAVFYAARRKGSVDYKRFAPFAVAILLIFAVVFIALTYFLPSRETRIASELPLNSTTETTTNGLAANNSLTIPKESQILFGIKTEPVSTRQITSGLKTTGAVRARPDARAVVVPAVAGRIVLREGLTLGSAVGRGEQRGYVEQVLDVSGQTELESQRLEVAAQQREVEAKRLEIKNTVLQLRGQQADQRAKAQQARTRLAQANRELRRSTNLVEVGAVPKKRVEEAQTAVKVAEQEVESSEQQVRLLESQIKQTQTGQNIFQSPRVNQPTKTFPLTAPVTGIINEIKATSGQIVEIGAEIMSVVNLSSVLIEANVFERDLPTVRESTRASFTSAALGGDVYTVGTKDGDGRLNDRTNGQ